MHQASFQEAGKRDSIVALYSWNRYKRNGSPTYSKRVNWWPESVILGYAKLTDSALEHDNMCVQVACWSGCFAHSNAGLLCVIQQSSGDNSWLSVVLLVGYLHQGRRQHCICLLDRVDSLVLLSLGFAYLLTISCLPAFR